MSVYLVAFSNQPQKGTACIYKDGVRVATYDERASRAPSTDYLLNQARQRCRYEDDTVEECNLDWPMPEKLDAKPKASGPDR